MNTHHEPLRPNCIRTEWGSVVEIPDGQASWEDLMDLKNKVYIERNRWIGERQMGVTILDESYVWAVVNGIRCRVHGLPFYQYRSARRNGFKPWLYEQLKAHKARFLPGFFDNLSVLM